MLLVVIDIITYLQLSGVAPPPLCRNAQQYLNANALAGDGSSRLNANAAVQARRKVLDDGKMRKVVTFLHTFFTCPRDYMYLLHFQLHVSPFLKGLYAVFLKLQCSFLTILLSFIYLFI